MSDDILIEDHGGGIAGLVLNRAPVNALNPAFLAAIAEAAGRCAADDAVRAVVISSPFKVFSAGLDLNEMQGYGPADETTIVDALNRTFGALYAFGKPLVAAVDGAAIAGGLFFALAADHTVAGPGARFGLAEVRVGVSFPLTPLEIARAELTPAGLRRLMLGGRPVDATTAAAFGIVDETVEPGQVTDRAIEIAKDLSGAPARAYAAVKAQVRAPALEIIRTAIRDGTDPARDGWFTEETKAAMRAALVR